MNRLTIPEVAERLRMSPRFVLDELKRGNLRGSQFGGKWRISEADLKAYDEAHMNVQPVQRRGRRSA